ncbi:MAG: hypothetical protein CM1200mP39_08760 [Dehalococcoidia bacterium]|nr:MAG: hypothetical protein CM1200mP39_08760 [Dehalococcoidia bacterium]
MNPIEAKFVEMHPKTKPLAEKGERFVCKG